MCYHGKPTVLILVWGGVKQTLFFTNYRVSECLGRHRRWFAVIESEDFST